MFAIGLTWAVSTYTSSNVNELIMDYIPPNIAMFVWERIYADTQEFEGKNLTNEKETFFSRDTHYIFP